MIRITNLYFKYPGAEELALKNVNLRLNPKTLTLVIGPSGSGKSTLLRCINGLIPHFSGGEVAGKIEVFGLEPINQGVEQMANVVGMVFQEPESQFVYDIVEDEIAFALENLGMERNTMHRRVDSILEDLSIENLRRKKIRDLSGGEKQKVAIASVLVSKPKVLLLDEPTSQLDPGSADEVMKLITTVKEKMDVTVIISEHRLERLLPYTDQVIYIGEEHWVESGSPQNIIPKKNLAPPIVQIAKKLNLKPVPLVIENFPPIELNLKKQVEDKIVDGLLANEVPLFSIKEMSTTINGRKILKNVSLNFNGGEILTLLGKNGSGKTTLLRSIMGLIPSKGEKFLKGKNISQLAPEEIIKDFAYLPQNPNDLLFAETILKELHITLENHGIKKDHTQMMTFLKQFDLADKSQRYPRDLSVGEIQRIALAAITIHDPRIILLDEPTRGLDYQAKENLAKILQGWRNEGRAVLLITQDVEFAAAVTDRTGILDGGQIIFTGSPITAFTEFPVFQTQTARLFPGSGWILPRDVQSAI